MAEPGDISEGTPETSMNSPVRILILDDEPAIAKTLTLILTGQGHSVNGFTNSQEALQHAAGKPPDIALLDFFVTGMTGIKVANELGKIAPHCRIILMSGADDLEERAAEAKAAGVVSDLLVKPFPPQLLIERVRTAAQAVRNFRAA